MIMVSFIDEDLSCLKHLTKVLVTSGKDELQIKELKLLKSICKKSENNVQDLYKIIMKWLRKKQAEIRYSAFKIINEIFERSHCFRLLVINDFEKVFKLCIKGLCTKYEFPKPHSAARKLTSIAIKTIEIWNEKFGKDYIRVNLYYYYLKRCKHVNFDRLQIITPMDMEKILKKERKQQKTMIAKVMKVQNELNEYKKEIRTVSHVFQNCFALVIPDVNNFHLIEDPSMKKDRETLDDDDMEFGSAFMRGHGIINSTTVQISISDINKVNRTIDNEILVRTLNDQVSIIRKTFLPKIKNWQSLIMPYCLLCKELVKQIVDLKRHLEEIINRFESVSFLYDGSKKDDSAINSDSDDDFIDVPLLYNEPEILGLQKNTPEKEKSSSISTIDFMEAGPSGIYNCEKTQPKDIDSFYSKEWEPSITLVKNSVSNSNQVWCANEYLHEGENSNTGSLLGVSTQIIDYQREFKAIDRECKAPLPSGKLCLRKDMEKCPFHGKIIPRDLVGKPLSHKDAIEEARKNEERERKNPAWQNPVLLAEIKRQTGVDLNMKKVKSRKKLYENLTPVNKVGHRDRLYKKLFKRRSKRK